jgi:cbb3-type cytochrome oxidase subunit 3
MEKNPIQSLLNFLAVSAFLLLFLLILWLAYIPNRSPEVNESLRIQLESELRDVQSKGRKLLTDYAVVDSAQGQYRIPIEQSMEITLRRIQKTQADRKE